MEYIHILCGLYTAPSDSLPKFSGGSDGAESVIRSSPCKATESLNHRIPQLAGGDCPCGSLACLPWVYLPLRPLPAGVEIQSQRRFPPQQLPPRPQRQRQRQRRSLNPGPSSTSQRATTDSRHWSPPLPLRAWLRHWRVPGPSPCSHRPTMRSPDCPQERSRPC